MWKVFGQSMLQLIMMVKVLLLPLFCLLTLLTGVCPQRANDIFVKDGEMVALYCPHRIGYDHGDAKVIWTSYTTQVVDLTNNVSSAEQRQMGMLIHERSLVILSASENHQGNYSCTGNASAWFRLTVVTTQSRDYEEKFQYPATCYTNEAFTLHCPDVNIPAENIPNITNNDIIWHKEGKSLPTDSYFSSVEENDRGVYTCTRSYLCYGQIYNMTFTVVLDVKPKQKTVKDAAISEPQNNHVFYVDLGSPKVIDCKAVMFSELDDLFWLSGTSIVKMSNSLPVFYNYTTSNTSGKTKMTASLVFKKVSEEDLSINYTCKLNSVSEHSSFVTINLAQKPRPSYLPLALGIAGTVVVMVLTVVIYVRFKINITLFLRDTIGCHSNTSDGKSYDAFLICYKSSTDAGLHENDRKGLENVLEERFGYSLCLYDRDILPGNAVAEAVLDCIEQSRTVVLVPTHAAPCPGSGLLSVIHEALVERQTRLVFIKTQTTDMLGSGLLPEALQLLCETGHCVTWKGVNSMPASSSFWKQLRYYLPSLQHAPKTRLLPQTV